MTGFQLRRLQITGPDVKVAEIAFGLGLNVVSGPSDTGKSWLVETIDYMLGGGKTPRQIPESNGYDTARLVISAHDGKEFELTRALAGGDFLCSEVGADDNANPNKMGQKHSQKNDDNVSSFLLSLIGLPGKRVRKNADNQQQNLTFRSLSNLVIIDEESIIKKESPIRSGESTQRTAQDSVFKLLLTGIDDSALIVAKKKEVVKAELQAQLALFDRLISQYSMELPDPVPDIESLQDQLARLDQAIEDSERRVQVDYSALESYERIRRNSWQECDGLKTRYAEITSLLERFDLLDQHYISDINRLDAVVEAGSFFTALKPGLCPLCGAKTGTHRHDELPQDVDVEATRAACAQESAKIRQFREELVQTVAGLTDERRDVREGHEKAKAIYDSADALLRDTLAPALSAARADRNQRLEARAELRQAINQVERVRDLQRKRADTESQLGATGRVNNERPGLPPKVVQTFSRNVEALLDAWRFPHEKPVYFDEKIQDLVIGARRRGDQGKGLRALTHAAFSVGLQQTCRELNLPTVGFVLLDSPLVTFREADQEKGDEFDQALPLEVKQAFYRDLAQRIKNDQVIIIENEDPDSEVASSINHHLFTKRADSGRSGFFLS